MTPSRVSRVWLSNAGHWQIRSSIASVSTILGKLLFPDSVSSSPSLSSKTTSSLTGSGFFTLLMHSIRASCLHPNVSITKEGSAVDTFSSQSTYSSAERSGQSSWTSADNSGSSSSSSSIRSASLFRKPHFSKQCFTVEGKTSFHTRCTHLIAIKMLTSLIMSEAETLSLIRDRTYLTNDFLYFTLKFRIIPASNGWSLDVVFFGRNIILMWENFPSIDSGWHVALSRNKRIFLFWKMSFLLRRDNTALKTSDVIHDFGFAK